MWRFTSASKNKTTVWFFHPLPLPELFSSFCRSSWKCRDHTDALIKVDQKASISNHAFVNKMYAAVLLDLNTTTMWPCFDILIEVFPLSCAEPKPSAADLMYCVCYGWPPETSGPLHKTNTTLQGLQGWLGQMLGYLASTALCVLCSSLENKLLDLILWLTLNLAVTFSLHVVVVGARLWSDYALALWKFVSVTSCCTVKGEHLLFNHRKSRYRTVFSRYWYLLLTKMFKLNRRCGLALNPRLLNCE